MKKKYLIRVIKIVLGLFITYFFIIGFRLSILSAHFKTVEGTYDRITGYFLCRSEEACVHEVGHWLNDSLGWPSDSEDFRNLVDMHIYLCRTTTLNLFMCEFEDFPGIAGNPPRENGWGGYNELYAKIYQIIRLDGEPDMPGLIRFYSDGWDE